MSIDHTNICPWPAPDWRSQLRFGDVVRFRFPVGGKSADEAFAARPCLVLDVARKGDERFAVLAYGTTEKLHSGRGYETQVSRRRELRLAGLDEPMRFIGSHRIIVSLDHGGFVLGNAGSPRLGTLTGGAEERMNAVRARLIAEHDIARERKRAKMITRTAANAPRTPLRVVGQKPGGTSGQAKHR